MGIKLLKKLIRKNAPGCIKVFNINNLFGKTIAIDSSILLYKFRYFYKEDNFHIIGFINKIIDFLSIGVKPVFIFDGKPPDAKKKVLDKRINERKKMKERLDFLLTQTHGEQNLDEFIDSEDETTLDENTKNLQSFHKEIKKIKKNLLYVNKTHSLEVMELLKSLGIPFLQSPAEAEEYCSFLQKNGLVDYIFTEDTDSLAFGGSNIIFKTKNEYEIINTPILLDELNLNYCQFVDLCILCGCDYTCTIPKIGPVNALNIIKKYGSIEFFLESNKNYTVPDSFDYKLARNLFKQNENYELVNFVKEDLNRENLTEILQKNNLIHLLNKLTCLILI